MRKRRQSEEDEISSEMEVDGEEKEAYDDTTDEEEVLGEDEGDGTEPSKGPAIIENPFLDSFYVLAEEDQRERSKAAQTIIQHCLLGSAANAKDAAYTLRRVLNGVCSGRAAARQGNATALSGFLKTAFQLGKMEEIREELGGDEADVGMSHLAYIRHRLIKATDPNLTTGKKKGSEERDYHFGRLFGILSIVRSNVLVSQGNLNGFDESKEVATALTLDLVNLFWRKKWMREPAAHGIITLLQTFCDSSSGSEKTLVATHLVKRVVVPKILSMSTEEDEGGSDHSSLVGRFCAEQLGIALFIQAQDIFATTALPFPLDESVLSIGTASSVSQALSQTSFVVQPRTHFVWGAVWNYLTKVADEPVKKGPQRRLLRESCPGGSDSPREIIELLIREVVMTWLLRLDPERSSGKATHERRALAMYIVKVLSGVPYMSSLSGFSQLYLDGRILENSVFSPEIIRALFLDVICAGNEKQNTSHLLKPLALEVLKETSAVFVEDTSQERRLAVSKALLNCEIRFDARTKTSTVSDLLCLMKTVQSDQVEGMINFWNGHLESLISSLLNECAAMHHEQTTSKATGYVELVYSFSKHVLRLSCESEEERGKLDNFKRFTVDRVLKFFLSSAFFDCTNVDAAPVTPRKKKGKRATKLPDDPTQTTANKLKELYTHGPGILYPIRSVISSRFFSLLSDFSAYSTHVQNTRPDNKIEKDSITLGVLIEMKDSWKKLESWGATRFDPPVKATKDDDEVDPERILSDIQRYVIDSTDAVTKDPGDIAASASKRCYTGIGVLAYSLYLHRLSCGESGQESDDPDGDDESDEEEICNALDELKDVIVAFEDKANADLNPLTGLAELCANLLSSPLGSGNMGRAASPKLIREAVKFAWLGGLRLASCSASDNHNLFDSSVVRVLLDAVGAVDDSDEDGDDETDGEVDESDDDDASESGESVDDRNVFSKAMDVVSDDDDKEDTEMATDKTGTEDDDDDSDVELDPTNLQSMLEEDSDADVEEGVLEHHEGADAALAKLIRLRQETRKAGQQAREKIELGHQLRCTFLLELLFGRSDSWNRLFQTECLLDLVLPMLQYRRKLERSLKKSLESRAKTGGNEKQAVLDRVTSILNQKICKLKIASLPLATPLADSAYNVAASKILGEARRAESKEQSMCCNSALVFVLRSAQEESSKASANFLKEAVVEWSTKRTTKLRVSLFDDLITHVPELSSQTLVDALAQSCKDARSPFLKTESFRLLTALFAKHFFDDAAAGPFLESVTLALQDEEMCKAKRVRVVLKTLEKYLGAAKNDTAEILSQLDKIAQELQVIAGGDSQGVSAMCNKIFLEIETRKKDFEMAAEAEAKAKPAGADSSTSKSKKKKKKKKK